MKKPKRLVSVFAVAVWSLLVYPGVSRTAGAQEKITAAPAKPIPAPAPYTGVKKRIAVAKFDDGAISASFTSADIGGGVAAQLTTALLESGRFVVLERATTTMTEIQREQLLSAQRMALSETAPPTTTPDPTSPANTTPEITAPVGKLIDAQMLIVGSVTEFEQAAKGGGMSIGVLGANLGRNVVEGHVGMDIRLVDTTNGQVLISKRVESRVPESSTSLKLNIHNVNFGDETFKKTPLGKATRSAIEKAVALIIGEMEAVPWRGQVADLLENQVLVNAGRDMGLQPGMIFVVSSIAKEVTDPATGLSLGVIEAPRGEIQVEQVQEKFSMARVVTGSLPKRGDLLRLKH